MGRGGFYTRDQSDHRHVYVIVAGKTDSFRSVPYLAGAHLQRGRREISLEMESGGIKAVLRELVTESL